MQKTLDIEPTSAGVRIFITNDALGTREHIALSGEDIKYALTLLTARDQELSKERLEVSQSEEDRLREMEHLLQCYQDFMRHPTIAGDEYNAISVYAEMLHRRTDELLKIGD